MTSTTPATSQNFHMYCNFKSSVKSKFISSSVLESGKM